MRSSLKKKVFDGRASRSCYISFQGTQSEANPSLYDQHEDSRILVTGREAALYSLGRDL